MEEFLTEVEASLIEQFVSNEELVNAVRKQIEFSIYGMGTKKKGKKLDADINWALSLTPAWADPNRNPLKTFTPESVGTELMIKAEALAEVKRAFTTLLEFKKKTVTDVINNPAK
jgi:hypothetical protein